ncbi:hypothetical protein LEAN103870_07295 [Legionella anisa]|uniref:hypothetical protein n=1 Tax=Legionella anisa TaxID=28082 RepID=UPI00073C20CC|nr:hypothetical protein [Legionella anisa]KTC68601.1 acetate kinase [Legionella anisa]
MKQMGCCYEMTHLVYSNMLFGNLLDARNDVIGENSAFVRDGILRHLEFLKPFETHIVSANEERMMALHAMSLLKY